MKNTNAIIYNIHFTNSTSIIKNGYNICLKKKQIFFLKYLNVYKNNLRNFICQYILLIH